MAAPSRRDAEPRTLPPDGATRPPAELGLRSRRIIRRPDGQVVQSPAPALRGRKPRPARSDLAQIGTRAGVDLELRITPDQVRYMLEEKLHPLGIVSGCRRRYHRLQRHQPLFGLRYRVGVLSPRAVTASLVSSAPLFLPPAMRGRAGGLSGLRRLARSRSTGSAAGLSHVIERPSLSLLLFVLAYVSLAFHEGGHAAACRYGGGAPGRSAWASTSFGRSSTRT